MKLRLRIAYDGGPFRGWQSQAGGGAVQDHLEAAFATLCGQPIVVHGAGRTDAGVHALGQVAHVEVPSNRAVERWVPALNGNLPPQIRVLSAARTRAGFHARHSATGKIYRYRIWNGPVLPPHELGRAFHLPHTLDLGRVRAAAGQLAGRHDFAAFAANRGTPVASTVRTLTSVTVRGTGPLVTIEFDGEGFLYRMVRLLAGTLVRIGSDRADPALITKLLEGSGKGGPAAPACGLWLVRVRYGRRINPVSANQESSLS